MSPHESYLEIYVNPHARLRARERFPGFKAARIVDEVRAAFKEGRVSRHVPSGIRVATRDYPDCLWASTPDGERVYAVKLSKFGRDEWVVVTTMRVEEAAA